MVVYWPVDNHIENFKNLDEGQAKLLAQSCLFFLAFKNGEITTALSEGVSGCLLTRQ